MIFREDKGENQLGLSGMSAKIINPKAIILRPLLNYPKQMLLNTLKQFGDFWVEDPSNINDKYARVRIRKYLYNIEYIKKNQLINKLYDNQKNRIQLESNLLSAIYESVKINAIGLIKINLILFNSYEKNVKMLMLRYLLKYASGDKHPVEIVKIDNLLQKIAGKIKVSLGGCIISIQKNYIKIFKEPNAVCDKMINFLNKKLWDGRFLSDNSNYYSLQKEDLIKILKNKEYKEFLKKYDINMVDIFSLPYIYHNKEISLNKDEKYNYFIVQSLLMSRFVAI
jgi:tRNA(Ile)-lysidine synthase